MASANRDATTGGMRSFGGGRCMAVLPVPLPERPVSGRPVLLRPASYMRDMVPFAVPGQVPERSAALGTAGEAWSARTVRRR